MRGVLLVSGMIRLPVMLIATAIGAAVIAVLSRLARLAVVLGTQVAGAEIGVVLILTAACLLSGP